MADETSDAPDTPADDEAPDDAPTYTAVLVPDVEPDPAAQYQGAPRGLGDGG